MNEKTSSPKQEWYIKVVKMFLVLAVAAMIGGNVFFFTVKEKYYNVCQKCYNQGRESCVPEDLNDINLSKFGINLTKVIDPDNSQYENNIIVS